MVLIIRGHVKWYTIIEIALHKSVNSLDSETTWQNVRKT